MRRHDRKDFDEKCECGKDDKKKGCNPGKVQLFCVNNVGATRFEGEDDEMVIWQDLAQIKVCAEKCSKVLHRVTGVIHARFEGDNDTASVADFQLRIIDEFGKVVCERRVQFIAELSSGDDFEVFFPWSIQCCEEVEGCDEWRTYRLQADLLDERTAENNDVWLQDIDWSVLVFENEDDKK